MIFRQNFVVPGHWFSPKKVVILWVRALTASEKMLSDAVVAAADSHMDY